MGNPPKTPSFSRLIERVTHFSARKEAPQREYQLFMINSLFLQYFWFIYLLLERLERERETPYTSNIKSLTLFSSLFIVSFSVPMKYILCSCIILQYKWENIILLQYVVITIVFLLNKDFRQSKSFAKSFFLSKKKDK